VPSLFKTARERSPICIQFPLSRMSREAFEWRVITLLMALLVNLTVLPPRRDVIIVAKIIRYSGGGHHCDGLPCVCIDFNKNIRTCVVSEYTHWRGWALRAHFQKKRIGRESAPSRTASGQERASACWLPSLFARVDSSYSGVDILLNPKQLMDVYHYHVDLASRNSCLDSGPVKHLTCRLRLSRPPSRRVVLRYI